MKTYQEAYIIKESLEENNHKVLGPSQAFILKRGEDYRFKLTIKHEDNDVNQIIKILKEYNNDKIRIIYTPFIDLE